MNTKTLVKRLEKAVKIAAESGASKADRVLGIEAARQLAAMKGLNKEIVIPDDSVDAYGEAVKKIRAPRKVKEQPEKKPTIMDWFSS
jgi:hypothetical protein